jgi:hypothetical protein
MDQVTRQGEEAALAADRWKAADFQGYAEEYRDKSASSSSALSDSYALPGASARPQKPHFFIPIQQI